MEDVRPHEVIIEGYDRFEGLSDPDDMSIVYAIESLNGTRGLLVDGYDDRINRIQGW